MKKQFETELTILKNLNGADIEVAHIEADNILCDILKKLGYEEIVNAYKEIYKWYA